jgi:predicted HAD superfamily Cof-like phosphohydrolase
MLRAKQEVPLTVSWPSIEVRRLRARLIFEEVMETFNAMGFTLALAIEEGSAGKKFLQAFKHEDFSIIQTSSQPEGTRQDIVNVVDGCLDIRVVTTGTLSAFGVADSKVQALVDDNNLAKFGPGHSYREDGKLVKPQGHKPPAIEHTLFGPDILQEGPKAADLYAGVTIASTN